MSIEGRMADERERLIGMTDDERAWRAKWIKDQTLHNEPVVPNNYYKERYNPIRRFYRAPLDALESSISKVIGPSNALLTRHLIGKVTMGLIFAYCTMYYFKYNKSDWTRKGGWKVTKNRQAMYIGDKDFPNFKEKQARDFATFGFENSPITK